MLITPQRSDRLEPSSSTPWRIGGWTLAHAPPFLSPLQHPPTSDIFDTMAFIHSVQMSPLRPKPTRPFEEHEYSSDNETGLHVTNTTHSRRQPEWRMSSSRPRAALPVARALDEHEYSSDVDSSSQVNNKNPSLRELRMSSSRPRVPVALDDSEHEYSSDVETSSQVNEHEYTSTGTVMQVRSLNRNQISSQRQRSSVTRGRIFASHLL